MSDVPEMVERVARAIAATGPFGHDMTEGEARQYARAAIAAMREPSEMMTKAGVEFALGVSLSGDYRWTDYIGDMHRRQIDAALTVPASASERRS